MLFILLFNQLNIPMLFIILCNQLFSLIEFPALLLILICNSDEMVPCLCFFAGFTGALLKALCFCCCSNGGCGGGGGSWGGGDSF